jgi:hypothetical protein
MYLIIFNLFLFNKYFNLTVSCKTKNATLCKRTNNKHETCASKWKFHFYRENTGDSILYVQDHCTNWCVGFRRLVKINKRNCPWCEFVAYDTNALFSHVVLASRESSNAHNNITLGLEKPFVSF